VVGFRAVSDNLRESFRILAAGRRRGSIVELPRVSIRSLGAAFQMFNAAFASERIETPDELEESLDAAGHHFRSQNLPWAFWICEDWLAPALRRKLSRTCDSFGLRLSSDLPGLSVHPLRRAARALPAIEMVRLETEETLNDFRALGSVSFHVPPAWFGEVFDRSVAPSDAFVCWVAYHDGVPVATAATVTAHGAIGLYNIATAPDHRQRGYGEAVTRFVVDAAVREHGDLPVVLQSTAQGLRLYGPMGFLPVTRVLVYNSLR
jgi:ribosomal protein S18 acetylase RimI-like enzyme